MSLAFVFLLGALRLIGQTTCDCPDQTKFTSDVKFSVTSPIAAGTSFTISQSVTKPCFSYQWQSSPAQDASKFTDIVGATNSSYVVTGITTTTYYRCKISCYNSVSKMNVYYNAPIFYKMEVKCSGSPSPGATTSSNGTALTPEKSTQLSISNIQTNLHTINYKWQFSSDGVNWTNSEYPGNAATKYNVGANMTHSLTGNTWFRCNATCTWSGQTAASTPILINYNPYCYAGGSGCTSSLISNVVFNTINNTSYSIKEVNKYEDFRSKSTQVKQSVSYPLSITLGSTKSTTQVLIWIDCNQDKDFDDAGEQVFVGNKGLANVTGNIVIPATAKPGTTTMRIRSHENSNLPPNACGETLCGQVEDYTVVILDNSCSGAPNPGATTSSISSNVVTQGKSFTLGIATPQDFSGINYQWQSASDGVNWVNIPGETKPTYDVQSITATTHYRCNVSCINSGMTVASTPLKMTYDPYCVAGSNNTYYAKIGNVVFNTINNQSTDNVPYVDYRSISTILKSAQTEVPITITQSMTYSYGQVIIWIDFNRDGDFDDAGEQVLKLDGPTFSGSQPGDGKLTGIIKIPSNVTMGKTVMRIRSQLAGTNSTPVLTPCGNSDQGQVEDYSVTFSPF